ncbi:aldo/keto reductase [Winogradskyella sp. 3972H.M.0a.05]|uniref:aldo/keto reductase n=1 Tax=Winogradskyella sp. 3972H.M.0a.05 TaxID=2950277 RepID=UPI0033967C38
MRKYTRREATKVIGGLTIGSLLLPTFGFTDMNSIRKRKIGSSNESLPIVGLGTWQSFDVGNNKTKREQLTSVLENMKEYGGSVIDSSPMYGSSESVVGDLVQQMNSRDQFFFATKVWTSGKQNGIDQMTNSMRLMKTNTLDLIQIHNLIDWRTHMHTLKKWKDEQKIRYWGITHYVDSAHDKLIQIIKAEKPDFVQFNYAINNLNAEKKLLHTAQENNVSVIINRPYGGGSLFRLTKGKNLPDWCNDYDIKSWGQFFLKYILASKAVTCVIPGTSKPHHLIDNMKAGFGRLPDDATRKKMIAYLKTL